MKTRTLRPFLAIALAAVLAVTSLSLAAARGQMRIAGAVVLCSGALFLPGGGDEAGDPDGPGHICPDMALSLLAAVAPDAPGLGLPAPRCERQERVAATHPCAQAVPAMTARGPPVLV